MYTSPVRTVRADLAAAVRRAEAGEPTIITVHGRPVAVLGPVAPATPPGGITIDQLVANGAVIRARRRTAWRPGDPVSVWTGTRIDKALREIRG
ncbi:MAG: type II toxin-antitoxin system prevent-host-death family antitoxin [Actinomycetota bacterium]|nr:type II toxin-antitoxin system prevent-host-death family antitoxin [Actinomycetota bacterium]